MVKSSLQLEIIHNNDENNDKVKNHDKLGVISSSKNVTWADVVKNRNENVKNADDKRFNKAKQATEQVS